MNSFELGKYAALEDMAEMIDNGADLADLIDAIEYSLDYPLQKNASEDDQDWRLGVESALHDFLSKTAEYYGYMDVEDEEEAILDVFDKVASNVSPDFGGEPSKAMDFWSEPGTNARPIGHSGASSPSDRGAYAMENISRPDPAKKTKKGARKRNVSEGAAQPANSRQAGNDLKVNKPKEGDKSPRSKNDKINQGETSPGMDSRASEIMAKLRGHGRSAADHLNKYKWHYGGAATLGAGALLARHLYKKRQEEQESGNSRKR